MSPRLTRIIGIIGTISLAACAPAADTEETAADDAAMEKAAPASAPITQQETEQLTEAFIAALRTGDATKIPDEYTSDGIFVSARGRLDGNDAIRGLWTEAAMKSAGQTLQVKQEKFGASGDLAYVFSRFTGGVTAPSGYTLQVLQRQSDGSAKIVAQISIPDAPAKN